jgi:hypothetical protein
LVALPIERRAFLAASAGVVATLAGCGGSKTVKVQPGTTPANGAGPGPFAVLANTFDFFSGIDQRVAIALADNNDNPIHPAGPVTIQIGPQDGSLGAPATAAVHGDGLANPYLLVRHQFPSPGTYIVRAGYQGKSSDLPIQVKAPSATPIPLAGKPMISVPSPTTGSALGVNPLCTRTPACPFHDASLDKALTQHGHVALLFATPALCQSKFCGPVLENLVAVHAPFADRVTFIHCEIYTDLTGSNSTGPVLAYHLEHEPLLLLAGPDGVVRERIDNAFDRGEATDALTRLVAS